MPTTGITCRGAAITEPESISAKCHDRALQTLAQAERASTESEHLIRAAHAWLLLAGDLRRTEEQNRRKKNPTRLKWDASKRELREW